MTSKAEIILVIYILFYILICFYDAYSVYMHKRKRYIYEIQKNKFISCIKNKDDRKLYKYLKKSDNLVILNDILDLNIKSINNIIKNNNFTIMFLKLVNYYFKKPSEDRTILCNILCYSSIEPSRVINFISKNLNSKNIYCSESVLNYIYLSGDSALIRKSFIIMSNVGNIYNYKLLSDGLTSFTGDKNELFLELYNNFSNFNDDIKMGILKYFSRLKIDKSKEIYDLLNKGYSKEVTISIIRYFIYHEYPKAINLFIERLNNNYYHDSDYDIVMIQTLKYAEVNSTLIDILAKKIEDNNYYVRLNSAKLLKKYNLIDSINSDDEYANELISYMREFNNG